MGLVFTICQETLMSGVRMTITTPDNIGPVRLGGLAVAVAGTTAPASVACLTAVASCPATATVALACAYPDPYGKVALRIYYN